MGCVGASPAHSSTARGLGRKAATAAGTRGARAGAEDVRARHLAASGVGSLRRVLPGRSGDSRVLLEPSWEALSPACFGF